MKRANSSVNRLSALGKNLPSRTVTFRRPVHWCPMDEIIVSIVERLGYFGIAVLMALENIFPPLPSEAIMGAGALAIENGRMSFWPLLIFATIGTVAGNYGWFWFGDRVGYEKLGPFIERWGRWLTLEWEDIERTSRFFQQRGEWAVFFLRFFPVMRTMISLPAGLAHMKLWKFLVFTTAGAAIWNAILIYGTRWLVGTFSQIQDLVGWIVIGSLLLAVAGYGWRLYTWKPRAER